MRPIDEIHEAIGRLHSAAWYGRALVRGAKPRFSIPRQPTDDDEVAYAAIEELRRLREPPADRGVLINRCASLGMAVTRLRAELQEVKKQARKTPRRDMHDERAKVAAAKARLDPMRAELEKAEADYSEVRAELVRLGHFPDPRTVLSNSESHGKDTGE